MSVGGWQRVGLVLTLLVLGRVAAAATVDGIRLWSGPDGTRAVFELSAPTGLPYRGREN